MRKELQRDDGLARLSRGTRWLTAGAFLSAGFLSVAVAETLPGRSSAASPAKPVQSTQPSQPGALPSSSSPSAGTEDPAVTAPPATAAPLTASPQTLSPPTAPPQTVHNPPVASSGGS